MVAQFMVIPLLLALLSLIFVFVNFDCLMKILYEDEDLWKANGRPCGFFWKPKELPIRWNWFSSLRDLSEVASFHKVGYRLSFSLLFRTPDWIKNDQRAIRCLFRYRTSVALYYVFFLLFIICFFLMGRC